MLFLKTAQAACDLYWVGR